jgi:hypothetical protein
MAVRAIVDRIRCRFSGPRSFATLTEGERYVYAIETMRGEVLNGGFHQYLTNSSGDMAEGTRHALAAIGAVTIAQILTRVARIFPGGLVPGDRGARLEQAERAGADGTLFDAEDQEFYTQEAVLDSLTLSYVRRHRAAFALPDDDTVRRLRRREQIRAHDGVSEEPEQLEAMEAALDELSGMAASWEAERQELTRGRIAALVRAGRRLEALRAYREAFACDLRDAKAAIDAMERAEW